MGIILATVIDFRRFFCHRKENFNKGKDSGSESSVTTPCANSDDLPKDLPSKINPESDSNALPTISFEVHNHDDNIDKFLVEDQSKISPSDINSNALPTFLLKHHNHDDDIDRYSIDNQIPGFQTDIDRCSVDDQIPIFPTDIVGSNS